MPFIVDTWHDDDYDLRFIVPQTIEAGSTYEAARTRCLQLDYELEANRTGIVRVRWENGGNNYWRWTINEFGNVTLEGAGSEVAMNGLYDATRNETVVNLDSRHGFKDGELVEYNPRNPRAQSAQAGAIAKVDLSIRSGDEWLPVRWIGGPFHGQEPGGYRPHEFISLCPRRQF